jgi:hypothetical protein
MFAYPSLLTRQWLRCSPSGVVRVDGCVAARAELGTCRFGVASPAPGLFRGADPRESPSSARSAGLGSGRSGSAEDLQWCIVSDAAFPWASHLARVVGSARARDVQPGGVN